MSGRFYLKSLLFAGLLLPLVSCSNPSLTSIVISPAGETATLAPCGDKQLVTGLKATGYYTHPDHAATTRDITDEVTWYSYNTDMVAFLNPTGAPGSATVTTCADSALSGKTYNTEIDASMTGFHGLVVGKMTFNVLEP
jgi:hypothetical protein